MFILITAEDSPSVYKGHKLVAEGVAVLRGTEPGRLALYDLVQLLEH